MPEVDLPEDGELRLGGVVVSGRRAYTEGLFGGGRLVAWVTDGRPGSGRSGRDRPTGHRLAVPGAVSAAVRNSHPVR
jgi:hypothetical protein